MTIDKQKLKALAQAATQNHGARRVEVDHNGVHVIGDGSWKILSAWHTPDGKGEQNAEFAAAASPATVLALLAEIERLESAKGDPVGSFDKHMEYMQENIRLKAENEALRKDAERYRVLRQADVDTIHNGGLFAGLTPDNIVINGHDLDRRTDAVIAARKEVQP